MNHNNNNILYYFIIIGILFYFIKSETRNINKSKKLIAGIIYGITWYLIYETILFLFNFIYNKIIAF